MIMKRKDLQILALGASKDLLLEFIDDFTEATIEHQMDLDKGHLDSPKGETVNLTWLKLKNLIDSLPIPDEN